MLNVTVIPVLADNYSYILECNETGEIAIIDPSDAGPILSALDKSKSRPKAIWNTHHHWDHVGGNEQLAEHYGIPVYGYHSDSGRIPGFTHGLEHEDRLRLGREEFRIIHTPGHTRGGITFLSEECAFTGDSLFLAGCGRIFETNAETLCRSLNDVLVPNMRANTKIYCGHEYTEKNVAFARFIEPENEELVAREKVVRELRSKNIPTVPGTLEVELRTNPFLRCDDRQLQECVSKRLDRKAEEVSVRQCFSSLRRLRDSF